MTGLRGLAFTAWLAIGLVLLGALAASAQDRYRLEGEQFERKTQLDPDSAAGRLQAIRALLAEGEATQAQKQVTQWIRENPDDPQLPAAYLLRGDAKLAQGEDYKALYDYEYLIKAYPASELYMTALQREFDIAQKYASGTRRKWLGLRMLSAKGEAEELFIRIQERAPGSDLGEKASLALGDYYYREAEMRSAVDAYDLFLANYPRSTQRQYALWRLINASLASFKGPSYDPTGLLDAMERLRQFRSEFPAEAEARGVGGLMVRIEESLAQKELHIGRWYERRGNDVSASYIYEQTVRDYPQTQASRKAMDRLAVIDPMALSAKEPRPKAPQSEPAEPAPAATPPSP